MLLLECPTESLDAYVGECIDRECVTLLHCNIRHAHMEWSLGLV
jgi:hypothetical protein